MKTAKEMRELSDKWREQLAEVSESLNEIEKICLVAAARGENKCMFLCEADTNYLDTLRTVLSNLGYETEMLFKNYVGDLQVEIKW